jgi:hypothetical protein
LLLAFNVIYKKLEKDLPPTPRRDTPTEKKLRLLMSEPKWRLPEANGQAKERNIPNFTGVGIFIPKCPIPTLQKG